MSESFGASAVRLAGMAGVMLGWRPEQFWRATPAELAAVLAALAPPEDDALAQADLQSLMEKFPDG